MTGTELSFPRIADPVIPAFRPYDVKTSLKRRCTKRINPGCGVFRVTGSEGFLFKQVATLARLLIEFHAFSLGG
jgi:hypothetical protein